MVEDFKLSLLIAGLFIAVLLIIGLIILKYPPQVKEISSEKDRQEIEELQQQCERLREELERQYQLLQNDFRSDTFQEMQNLLTNYPTVRKMAQVKPNLPAKNLTALFTSLDNLLANWDYESIGQPWEKVTYDPQLHQADSDNIAAGEEVYVRFIGYRHGETIIYPAKVSRTLPGGMKQ